ncbi:MAG: SDR family oxidoreductase [Magnetovibrio sp.]|nr:SDR family oxidoreductase [Magnetovibrio sp.]
MSETGDDLPSPFAPELNAGKVALVTGGGTGMGRATAIGLARTGAKLALYGRRLEVLEDCAAVIEGLGAEALCVAGDTREEDQVAAAMAAIRDRFGRLDILVNNAGGQFVSAARDLTNKGFEAVIRNNLVGSWQMTKAAADAFMFEAGGKVVFVTAAHRSGFRGFAHTAAARGGVSALMKSLAAEWAEYGILLNAVAPGTIKVDAMAQYPIPPERWMAQKRNLLGRMGAPADVANTIIFLASPMGDFITGEEWYVDGGETLNIHHDSRELIDADMFRNRQRSDEA